MRGRDEVAPAGAWSHLVGGLGMAPRTAPVGATGHSLHELGRVAGVGGGAGVDHRPVGAAQLAQGRDRPGGGRTECHFEQFSQNQSCSVPEKQVKLN